MKPKVSVIWPTYNHAEYLYFALESLASQTFKDFEVMIWDDGSTDNTKDVIAHFEPKLNIKTFFEKNHNGDIEKFTNAWNTLAQEAKGEFLCPFASSSLTHPTKLQKQLEVMRSEENAACYSIADHIDSKGMFLNDGFVAPKGVTPENTIAQMFFGNFIPTPSVMIRRKIFLDLGGFRAKYKFIQDYDMWFRALKKGKFIYIEESLIAYRIHSTSRSQDPQIMRAMSELIPKLISEMYEYFEIQDIIPELKKYDPVRNAEDFAQVHIIFGNHCLNKANLLKEKGETEFDNDLAYLKIAASEFSRSLEYKISADAYAGSACACAGLGKIKESKIAAENAIRLDRKYFYLNDLMEQ